MAPWQIAAAVVVVLIAAATVYGFTKLGNPDVSGAGTTPTGGDISVGTAATPVTALWLGDSYTAGTGATTPAASEACLTSDALGWECLRDAEGGTGYLADGHKNSAAYQPAPARLAATKARFPNPGIVLVDLGRNEGLTPWAQVKPVATKYLNDVRATWPNARLVLIVPYYLASTGPISQFAELYRAQAGKLHATVVDPIADGWIDAASAKLTISDHVHPNPAGHEYIAKHLAAELRRDGLPVRRSAS
jgi:lysophospholipase L1-like esterase